MKFVVQDEPVTDAEAALARRVRELRLARGWSQEDLATKMTDRGHGWHQTTAAKTENASRPIRVNEAQALAEVLGVPLLDLLADDGGDKALKKVLRDFYDVNTRSMELQREIDESWQQAQDANARYESASKELKKVQAEQRRLAALWKETRDRG